MAKHQYVVRVARPHQPRFEPDRPITDLVRNQLLHLSLAQRGLPEKHRAPTDVYSIRTEEQASDYIRHITRKLHERAEAVRGAGAVSRSAKGRGAQGGRRKRKGKKRR
jgi:hypothetical protein